MAEYKRVEDKNGKSRYMADGKFVAADNLGEDLRDQLDSNEAGTVLDENGDEIDPETESDDGSGTESADKAAEDARAAAAEADEEEDERVRQTPIMAVATEQSDPGMGFPRVKGYTVDIFDGKTPHTHVRNVNGLMVPLSEENYKTKTDTEIISKLKDLKLA